MKTKKSKYFGREVKLCRLNRETGRTETVSGIFRGFLGKKNVVIDTGKGLFEQYIVGTAPGRWLIFPASVQIIHRPAPSPQSPPKKKQTQSVKEDKIITSDWSMDSDDVLPLDWSADLNALAGNDPYRFSVDFEADL
jgi:hypothetical protein